MRKARVLVVEDDAAVRRLVAMVLQDLGFDVQAAPDGRSAVQTGATERPDLVLLDYMLPDDNGDIVAEALRQRWGELPILLMSAADHPADKARVVGAVGRVDKPFELGTLEAAVWRALRVADVTAVRGRRPA